jgi:hypothetical protein
MNNVKKILFLLLCATSVFAQSVTIEPLQISKTRKTNGDDLVLNTLEGKTPTIIGRRANIVGLSPMLTTILPNENLLTIGIKAYNGIGFTNLIASSVIFESSDTWTPVNNGSRIKFFTCANGTGASVSRMVIDHNGNVGVGNLSPNSKFQLSSGSSGVSSPTTFHMESNTHNYLTVSSPDAFASGIILKKPGSEAQIYYGAANSSLDFYIGGENRLNIRSTTGNVGIGTNINANTKLQVVGDFALSKITTNTTGGTMTSFDRADASILKFENGGDLYGISLPVNGLIVYIMNTSTTNLVIHDESTVNVPTTERIITNNIAGGSTTINSRGGATLIYDAAALRWRVVSVAL